jgi:hypothetical protein
VAAGFPRTALWQYVRRGRIRRAMPRLVIEQTPERVATLIIPGVVTRAPKDFVHERYVQGLVDV